MTKKKVKLPPIDPELRGRKVAAFYLEHGPALFADLIAADAWGARLAGPDVRHEWDAFTLYACVRGIVAAGGFNIETAATIDVLHTAVLGVWSASGETAQGSEPQALISARYEEYGAIGQAGGASGASTVSRRLGEAAARHLLGTESDPAIAELAGALHEALAEAVTAQLRER